MTDEKPKYDPKDVLFYAPIGMAMTLKDLMPSIVEALSSRGRTQVEQMHNAANNVYVLARSVAQMRVGQAQTEARKRTDRVKTAAESGLKVVQGFDTPPGGTIVSALRGTAGARPESAGNGDSAFESSGVNGDSDGSEGAHLAIPDYDTLSATQIAQRLNGLDSGELSEVRDYEASHRGRKTIISKINALLEG
ncbi:MAG: hypothetical protein IT198_03680 [Acidimicrobiia bacterium]|nr:hypothetical protein [Acidimicrobiia bacterium]